MLQIIYILIIFCVIIHSMKIENIDKFSFKEGKYSGVVTIQFLDPENWPSANSFPTPKEGGIKNLRYQCFDIENEDCGFTFANALEVVQTLQFARENNLDVTAHCMAGISRSGAVAAFAEAMGFEWISNYRNPNNYILQDLVYAAKQLGVEHGEVDFKGKSKYA